MENLHLLLSGPQCFDDDVKELDDGDVSKVSKGHARQDLFDRLPDNVGDQNLEDGAHLVESGNEADVLITAIDSVEGPQMVQH